ncbi:MAG: hypothetical protein IT343_24015 [Candidatus Melainabacteria bacterium]|nr:hypothetical protein [Candidatus Melainabacteria bacterium]
MHEINTLSDEALLGPGQKDLEREKISSAQYEQLTLQLDKAFIFEEGRELIKSRLNSTEPNAVKTSLSHVEGQIIGIAFPVRGAATLLAYKPVNSGFTSENAGVDNHNVRWIVEGAPEIDPELLRTEGEIFRKALEPAVESIKASVATFNCEIERKIVERFKERISQAQKRREALNAIGLPVHIAPNENGRGGGNVRSGANHMNDEWHEKILQLKEIAENAATYDNNKEGAVELLAGLKKRGNPARLLKRLTGSEEKRLSFERRHVVC